MKRRSFLFISFAGAAAITIPLLNCNNRDESIKKYLVPPLFLSHICDAKTIREIGIAYKTQFPAQAAEASLLKMLLEGDRNKSFSLSSGNRFTNSFLEEKVGQDFNTGKTVMVSGWVLSVTEAQQCALFSIMQQ